jgi:hypothetical protein
MTWGNRADSTDGKRGCVALALLGVKRSDPRSASTAPAPTSPAEIGRLCEGKKFLNFDDAAYGPAMQAFLAERFPEKCKYER